MADANRCAAGPWCADLNVARWPEHGGGGLCLTLLGRTHAEECWDSYIEAAFFCSHRHVAPIKMRTVRTITLPI